MAVSVSGIIYRLVKGTPLTLAEGDGNLHILADAINALDVLFGVVLKPDGTLKDNAVDRSAIIKDGVVTNVKLAADAKIPPGVIMDYAGTPGVPAGWLECNGQAVARIGTYNPLFLAIGTVWGVGDGANTFNVPDLSRRVTVGRGGSGNPVLNNVVGALGGEEVHLLTAPELPAHNHGMPTTSLGMRTTLNVDSLGIADNAGVSGTGDTGRATFSTVGADTPHNNFQPSAVVTKIIKF